MNERILVIAAHPDDEVLGLGGTLARHAALGDRVDILIMAEGITSRDQHRDVAAHRLELEALRQAAGQAAAALGANPPRFGGLPDNRMDSLDLLDMVKLVESHVREVLPDIVYTHHAHDLNIDHQLTHQAVLTACRPLPGSTVRAIFTYETVSNTEWGMPGGEFIPTHFVEITKYLDLKIVALQSYAGEMRPSPHPRSLDNVAILARLRGSSVGVPAAEAFGIVRQLVL